MNIWDYTVIGFYILVIVGITLLTYSTKWKSVFSTSKKTKWWIAGISLFMAITAVDGGQIVSGIIHEKGIWGLWVFWCSGIFTAIVPLLFAPLWAKLNFITDNEFILFRYSGKGAKILHQFRAIYVGGIIVSFLLSFQVLGFAHVLTQYFDIHNQVALSFSGGLLLLFALKNSFEHKLNTDVFHTFLYIALIVIGGTIILSKAGGWSEVITVAKNTYPEKLQILPSSNNTSYINILLVYILVLWWSAQMFDGGGPEAQRFFSTKGKWHTVKAAFVPAILNQGVGIFIILIILSGMALETQNIISESNNEKVFISYFSELLPHGLKGFSLVAFFAAFITTAESLMNWGASFLVVDVYKKHLPAKKDRHYVRFGFIAMATLSLLAFIVAFNSTSLQGLIHLLFSISAGVAPVFILRWVWLRINAWSQLSAMISSLVYTKMIDGYFDQSASYFFELEYTSFRLITVTLLTTVTWLVVTFLTKKDDPETLDRFKAFIPKGHFSLSNILFAFAIGIGFTGFVISIIYILFN